MRKVILSVLLTAFAAIAWALPTLQEVETEVQAGRYAQAETMMREVVDAKPGSAKAHYVYAEILAHQGKLALASEEAQKARVIDPDVKFTDPAKFQSFEAGLRDARRPAAQATQDARRMPPVAPVAPVRASTGIPSWVWLVGIVIIGALLWRGFSRSRNAATAGYPAAMAGQPGVPGQPTMPGTYGPGYGPVPPGYPSQRSSMLGTGLAAAGGVAAGMLAGEMLHRHSGRNEDEAGSAQPAGYLDSPDGAGNALEDRPIDFGNGGDWDAGGGGDVGGGDTGGGWD